MFGDALWNRMIGPKSDGLAQTRLAMYGWNLEAGTGSYVDRHHAKGRATLRNMAASSRSTASLATGRSLIGRTLVLEDYPDANLKWCQAQDVQFMVRPTGPYFQVCCLQSRCQTD